MAAVLDVALLIIKVKNVTDRRTVQFALTKTLGWIIEREARSVDLFLRVTALDLETQM